MACGTSTILLIQAKLFSRCAERASGVTKDPGRAWTSRSTSAKGRKVVRKSRPMERIASPMMSSTMPRRGPSAIASGRISEVNISSGSAAAADRTNDRVATPVIQRRLFSTACLPQWLHHQAQIVLTEQADDFGSAEAHVLQRGHEITELLRLNEIPRRSWVAPRPAIAAATEE